MHVKGKMSLTNASYEDDGGWNWHHETWVEDLQEYLEKTILHLTETDEAVELNNVEGLYDLTQNLGVNHTNATLAHDDDHGLGPTAVFFIFTACAIGGKLQHTHVKMLTKTVVMTHFANSNMGGGRK